MEHSTLLKGKAACLGWLLFALAVSGLRGDDPQQNSPADQGPAALKKLSLEELSQLEVTAVSKKPEKAFQTPAAIFVITGDDIRRSGATSLPEALRLAPGVEVARIDGNKWSIGIRGFGSRLSRSVLVMIDGRTVYAPLFAGTYLEVQDTRASQAGFRMERNPNNNSRYTCTLQGDIYKEEAGESVAAVTYAAPYQRIVDANADLSGGNVMGVRQRKLAGGGDFQLQTRFTANPNFAPELMNGYQLGYRRLLGKNLLVDLTNFYNRYHDLFGEELTGPVFLEDNPAPVHYLLPAQFRNGLLGCTKGVEVAPEWRVTSRWRLRGSYSFLHMNLAKSPHSGDVGTAPGIVGSSLQREGWIQWSLDLGKSFQLDRTYRHESALPGQLEPAYSTGDARLALRAPPELELSPVGQNLLQPFHREFVGDPGALVGIRRNAYLKLTCSR